MSLCLHDSQIQLELQCNLNFISTYTLLGKVGREGVTGQNAIEEYVFNPAYIPLHLLAVRSEAIQFSAPVC